MTGSFPQFDAGARRRPTHLVRSAPLGTLTHRVVWKVSSGHSGGASRSQRAAGPELFCFHSVVRRAILTLSLAIEALGFLVRGVGLENV